MTTSQVTCCLRILLIIFTGNITHGQITVHSITDSRQIGGDVGYTLDGKHMVNSSRQKLLNPANFGPQGTYPKTIIIKDGFGVSGSLTEVTKLPKEDLFFFGSFNKIEPAMQPFTDREIDSLYKWSLKGGKMIITPGLDFVAFNYYTSILNKKWNYQAASLTGTVGCYATPDGKNTTLFNGPFGEVNSLRQGGAARGIYYKYPSDIKIMAIDKDGNPTIYMDCKTMDLMIIDVDILTSISNVAFFNEDHQIVSEGISNGAQISLNNDIFLGNLFAFMDQLQLPPLLVKNGDQLSVQDNYLSYQWYKNGEPIGNANAAAYTAASFGEDIFHVEVEVNGGCKVRSNEYNPECDFFVPSAFSPNDNNMNEKLCVHSSCIDEMELKIFDRWGELIFTSSESEPCWDGTYKGAKAPPGVYAWSMEGTRKSGTKMSKKGNVTLIR